jgi:hypothetical protein
VLLSEVDAFNLNLKLFVTDEVVIENSNLTVSTFRVGTSGSRLKMTGTDLTPDFFEASCQVITEAGEIEIDTSTFSGFSDCAPLLARDNPFDLTASNNVTSFHVSANFADSPSSPIVVSRGLPGSIATWDFSGSSLTGGCGVGVCICANSLADTVVNLGGGTTCNATSAACSAGAFGCD